MTGSQESITALTKAAGFGYQYNEQTMQFAHAALSSLGTRKREASASRIGIKVRKCKKMVGLRFAASAPFGQREQLDWELRVKRREIWRA